jgi:dTDP-4-dehydrorhamnose 3,5-epimerase-like enzyme
MKATPTALKEVLLLEPRVFGDARGFFFESFNQKVFEQASGVGGSFVQDNHSRSSKGVLASCCALYAAPFSTWRSMSDARLRISGDG